MKKLLSKFSDKLLSKEKLRTVMGGTCYCDCSFGFSPVPCGTDCNQYCQNNGGGGGPGWCLPPGSTC